MEGKRERKTSLISQTETLNYIHCSIPVQQQQQHEAQKMEDLKKAYADVILNTAKEAAARVMASDQRALRFQHELASAKDDALHMLLRLKQMMDAKTAEAEITSLNQQRKIQELEAQLNEAEDIITDLRTELKQVWFELEKTKNSQVQSFDGQNIKQVAPIEESAKPETLVSSPNREHESVTNYDEKNETLAVNALDDKCCNSAKQIEQLRIPNLEDCYANDSDFASIIVRSKEPELCKNGCTQRIRALEGNLLDEKMLSRDVHNQHFGIKNGFIVNDRDGQVAKSSALSARTKKMEIKKHVKCYKKLSQKIFSNCKSCLLSSCKSRTNENRKSNRGACSLPSIKPCAISKWKRNRRIRRYVRRESSVIEHCKSSSLLKRCSAISDNGKCCEDEYVAKKPVLPLSNVGPLHGSTGITECVQAANKFELVEKAIEMDTELLEKEGSASQNLTGPSSNMKVEVVVFSSTLTDLEDAKAFEENDGSPGQGDARLLKYTFQRKRKKESLGNQDQKTDSGKSTAKRRLEEKQHDAIEPQKYIMTEEPFKDTQRMAQVACQLISLSAKSW